MLSEIREKRFVGGLQVVEDTEYAGTIGWKIFSLRKSNKMTQSAVARAVGAAVSTVSRWERNEMQPHMSQAKKLSRLFNVSVDEFVNDQTPNGDVTPLGAGMVAVRRVPIVGAVQAGAWKEAVQFDGEDRQEIPVYMQPSQRDLIAEAYLVVGPSMNKLYPHGSVVIVASTIGNGILPQHGQRVLVQRQDRHGLYEATLKELVVAEDGSKWLWPRSTDPEFQQPIAYKDGADDVTITGVVIHSQINELGR